MAIISFNLSTEGEKPVEVNGSKEINVLYSRLKKKNSTIKILKRKLKDANRKLNESNQRVKNLRILLRSRRIQQDAKLRGVKKTLDTLSDRYSSVVSRFGGTQIRIMTSGITKPWWGESDISKALSLRAKSVRAYEFVRNQYKIPLPCLRTLQTYLKEIRFDPGFLYPVFNLLQYEFQDAEIKKR